LDAVAIQASNQSESPELNTQLQIALLKHDLATLKQEQQSIEEKLDKLAQLEIEQKVQQARVEEVKEGIQHLDLYTNFWGSVFTFLTLIITVAVIVLGFTAKRRAVTEATDEAQKAIKKYINEDASEEAKVSIESVVKEAKEKIEHAVSVHLERLSESADMARQATSHIENQKTEADKHVAELRESNKLVNKELIRLLNKDATDEQKQEIRSATKENPETFEDWFIKGLDSFHKQEFTESLQYFEKANQLATDDIQMSQSLFAIGAVLSKQSQSEKAIETYQALVAQFKESSVEEVQVRVAGGMVNLGIDYSEQGQSEKAIETYQALIAQFKASSVEAVQTQVAKGMFYLGIDYSEHGQSQEAIETFKALIAQFKESSVEEIQIRVASGMLNLGIDYREQDQSEKALETFKDLIAQFKDSSVEAVQTLIAGGMVNLGSVYGKQGQSQKAIETYQGLVAQFKDSDVDEIKQRVAGAAANYAELSLLISDDPEELITRVEFAESRTVNNSVSFYVMKFLRFILGNINQLELLSHFEKIPNDIQFSWRFDEIRDYLNSIQGKKGQQVQLIVQFFEVHHDMNKLKHDLDNLE
jgi:tetratricopeptide (TPR) repeat protein